MTFESLRQRGIDMDIFLLPPPGGVDSKQSRTLSQKMMHRSSSCTPCSTPPGGGSNKLSTLIPRCPPTASASPAYYSKRELGVPRLWLQVALGVSQHSICCILGPKSTRSGAQCTEPGMLQNAKLGVQPAPWRPQLPLASHCVDMSHS